VTLCHHRRDVRLFFVSQVISQHRLALISDIPFLTRALLARPLRLCCFVLAQQPGENNLRWSRSMMTLTASPRTTKTPAPITLPRRPEATGTKAPARRSFLQTLLRALAAVAV
jgi:hypothetical protein